MEDETQVDDTITSSGDDNTTDEETSDINERLAQLEAELEKEREAKKQLTARAKRAEELAKTKTSKTSEAPLDVDERILKANGMSDELLRELKIIANARGVDLFEAQTDKSFVAIKNEYEREAKLQEASLGGSKGSQNVKPKKDFNTPNLSRDEHREMVKQRLQS